MKHTRTAKQKRELKNFAAFSLPGLIIYTVFWIAPIVLGVVISFTNWNGIIKLSDASFVGLKNYKSLFSDDILAISLKNNLIYGIITLVIVPIVAFIIAYVIEEFTKHKPFWRTIAYLPAIIPGIVTAFLWKWIYNPQYGLLNAFLKLIGLGSLATGWITNSDTALVAVTVTSLWKMIPTYFILFLAGLQTIPKDLIEAAVLDGAGRWQLIKNVTIPCIHQVITIVYVLVFIDVFRVFDLIYQMTNGGPGYYSTEMLLTYAYKTTFTNSNAGYGMAIISVVSLFAIVMSAVQIKVQSKKDY